MTTEQSYTWSSVREDAVARFGETPGVRLEAEVVDAFERSPAVVLAEIERVADDLGARRIRTGWGILRSRLVDAGPVRDVTVAVAVESEPSYLPFLKWAAYDRAMPTSAEDIAPGSRRSK